MSDYLEINYEKNMEMLSKAYNYCEETLSHQDIINELYNDDDLKKQLCLIELNKVQNQKEADILVFNLTNHSGPIRETASYKILDLISQKKFCDFFQTKEILNTFIKAVTDINPSVSRNTVEIIKYTNNKKYIYEKLINEIKITLSQMQDIKQNRSYTVNKKNFNIYWNLEAIINIADFIRCDENLIYVLNETAKSNDYTIREKTAKCAKTFSLTQILNLFKEDQNIYVRKFAISN